MWKFRKTTEAREEVEADATTTDEDGKKVREVSEEESQAIEEKEAEEVDFLHLTNLKEEALTEVLPEVPTEILREENPQEEVRQDVLHLQEEEIRIQGQDVQEEVKN